MRAFVQAHAAGLGERAVEVPEPARAVDGETEHQGQARPVADVDGDPSFAQMRERLADDVIDALFGRPADLLLEHGAGGRIRRRVVGVVHVGIAGPASEQRAGMAVDDPAGDGDGIAVELLQQVFPADKAQSLAVAVIGEGEHHIRTAAHQLLVQLLDDLRMVDHDFRHIAAGRKVAAPFHLEEVAAAVDDSLPGRQAFSKRSGHGRPLLFAERRA